MHQPPQNPRHPQPIQPLLTDNVLVACFQQNAIVRFLLDWASERGMDLNKLATMPFSNADRQQFAQLIGYSLSGYGELSYVDDEAFETAERMLTKPVSQEQARADVLAELLDDFREETRAPIARLFGIHPDDLGSFSERKGN